MEIIILIGIFFFIPASFMLGYAYGKNHAITVVTDIVDKEK